jgi:GT2 family glycosyltransferase
MLSFSVVVPVRNAARTLPDCLGALARLDPAPTEALLVDNGSTDRSLELLHAFARNWRTGGVQVLTEPRRGPAAARNAGVRRAKGDVIAFTDADCVPEVGWLHYLAEPLKDPIVGAVAGRVVAAPASSIPELFSALYTLKLPDKPARQHQWTPWEGGYPTANLAVRRRLFEDVGAFDERLRIGEDYDLCARLYGRGAEIAYVPAARVAHHHRTTLLGMLRQSFDFGRAHPCLLQRHAAKGLWIDLPGRSFLYRRWPGRAWVDLASADKKMLAILALGGAYHPALLLLPLYAIWLVMSTTRRAREAGTPVSAAAIGLAVLLVLKSTAMTAGRWWGSLRYGALCL